MLPRLLLVPAILLVITGASDAAEERTPGSAPTPPLGRQAGAVPVQLSAKWGEGVQLWAGDLFSMQLRLRAQILAGISVPSGSAVEAGAADEITSELIVRRLRLRFEGHAFTPKLRYVIQLGFSSRDLEPDLLVPLRDAYLTWQPLRDLGIRFGQMKVPYGRQRVISSSDLQMVDRSIVTDALNLDRDVGVYLLSEDFLGLGGRLMYQAGVFSGRGRNRGPAMDGIMYAARIQVSPLGRFESLDDLTEGDVERGLRPRVALGLSVAQNFNSNRHSSTHEGVYDFARFTFLHAGADLLAKWRGTSLLGEFFYRGADRPDVADPSGSGGVEYARSAIGYFVQGGYVFPLSFEIVARWGELYPLKNTDPEFALQREAGCGLNFYFWEHSLKIQGDYFYLFGADPRAVRHQARVQLQLYF